MRELTFQQLEALLEIDPDDLDTACARHADLSYRVSKQLAMEQSLRDAAKQNLAEIEAKADLKVRKTFDDLDKKTTEGLIRSNVLLHHDVIAANEDLQKRNIGLLKWTALKEAYMQRSYMLKSLVDLAYMNYYSEPTGSPSVRDKLAERNRAAISTKLRGEKHG